MHLRAITILVVGVEDFGAAANNNVAVLNISLSSKSLLSPFCNILSIYSYNIVTHIILFLCEPFLK